MKSEAWLDKLKQMIPSYGQLLNGNTILCQSVIETTSKTLKLDM